MVLKLGDVNAVIARLPQAFHSEAEFQFAFAWELAKIYPSAKVFLEHPMKTSKWGFIVVDLVAEIDGDITAIEFKYKTTSLATYASWGLKHDLKNHSAINEGCYDYMKDIERVEDLKKSKAIRAGYAIFLTNDSSYWDKGKKASGSSYVAFQFFENPVGFPVTIKKDSHSWSITTKGTMPKVGKERINPIVLSNSYIQSWQDYKPGTLNPFRCFIVEV